jgi:hypothetical protein
VIGVVGLLVGTLLGGAAWSTVASRPPAGQVLGQPVIISVRAGSETAVTRTVTADPTGSTVDPEQTGAPVSTSAPTRTPNPAGTTPTGRPTPTGVGRPWHQARSPGGSGEDDDPVPATTSPQTVPHEVEPVEDHGEPEEPGHTSGKPEAEPGDD